MFCKERWIRFPDDESGGERDTLTTLLVLAVVVIPLVFFIVLFRDDIMEFAKEKWRAIQGTYEEPSSL